MWHRPLLLIQKIFLSFKQTLYFNNQQYFSIKDLNVDFKNNDKEEVREEKLRNVILQAGALAFQMWVLYSGCQASCSLITGRRRSVQITR